MDSTERRIGGRPPQARRSATTRRLVALLLAVCAVACRPPADSAEGTAERFLDEHYVKIDLAAAKQYTVGPARQKIEEEQRLVGDQQIDQDTRKPHVSYERLDRREDGPDRVIFLYRGEIWMDGTDSFERKWLVTTKREADGKWKVSNFQEFD